ncbi:MAG TPA: DegV family protein [Verrucomicrobiae bacterium]|nr:DegV family protein [Verrucomicrobiae bacterium]
MTRAVGTALVVDSSACLPPGLGEAPWVTVVPMTLHVDGHDLRDGIDIGVDEFYARLRQPGPLPTSSSPAPGAYLEAFRSADADAVVCLTIPERYSMMGRSAKVAVGLLHQEEPRRVVHVIDTGTAAGGYTLVAEAAARACAEGLSAERVVEHARAVAAGAQVIGALETLRFLTRSGRVPTIAALGGDLLRVRPVFALSGSDVTRLAVVRGTRHALRTVAQQLRALTAADIPLRLAVFTAGSLEMADQLAGELVASFGDQPIERLALTPVIALHTGPGLIGAAAVPDLPLREPSAAGGPP